MWRKLKIFSNTKHFFKCKGTTAKKTSTYNPVTSLFYTISFILPVIICHPLRSHSALYSIWESSTNAKPRRNLQSSLQQNYIRFDVLTEGECPETLLWKTNMLCLESYLCSASSLQCVFLCCARGKYRHHILLLRIIIIHHYHPLFFFFLLSSPQTSRMSKSASYVTIKII